MNFVRVFGNSLPTGKNVGLSNLRSSNKLFVRNLGVHEYLSMKILSENKVNVPKGKMVTSADEAYTFAKELVEKDGVKDVVVKAQVLAGGRGRGRFSNGFNSGVHIAFSPSQASDFASKMIGNNLITKQTVAKGLPCNKVFICERVYARREFYMAIMLDRSTAGPLIIGSSRGGMNIEDVAKEDPNAIMKLPIDINCGLKLDTAKEFLRQLGFTEECVSDAAEQLIHLYDIFVKKDCTLIEINPFCETNDGKVFCVDCKLQFDLNALYRQPEVYDYIDNTQIDPREYEAAKFNLNYVGLEGNIGCLVNGAGLAMSTMDIIKLNGGSPANFLDVGGGATKDQVKEAFKLITKDGHVKAILVNIFGGIMRCDVIAEGIIEAAHQLKINIPIVVRLQGSKMEEARALIANENIRIIPVDELDSAAKLVCKLAHIVEIAQEAKLSVNFELPL